MSGDLWILAGGKACNLAHLSVDALAETFVYAGVSDGSGVPLYSLCGKAIYNTCVTPRSVYSDEAYARSLAHTCKACVRKGANR